MLNIIWAGIMALAAIFGVLNGTIEAVVRAIPDKVVMGFNWH